MLSILTDLLHLWETLRFWISVISLLVKLTFVDWVLVMSNSLKWPQHSCMTWPQWGVVVKVTTATESRLNSVWHIPLLRGAANILVKKWWIQIKFTETDIDLSVPDQYHLQWPKSGHRFRSWAGSGARRLLRLQKFCIICWRWVFVPIYRHVPRKTKNNACFTFSLLECYSYFIILTREVVP